MYACCLSMSIHALCLCVPRVLSPLASSLVLHANIHMSVARTTSPRTRLGFGCATFRGQKRSFLASHDLMSGYYCAWVRGYDLGLGLRFMVWGLGFGVQGLGLGC
jgi:hypothetical protein